MVFWLAACRTSAPGLDEVGRAVAAWEAGRVQLDGGDAAGALRHFDEAVALRPDDALLVAWSARAAAATGDLDDALARLDRAIAQAPAAGVFRWQRAAYRARAGQPVEAAADLRDALTAGAVTPRQALRDPDLAGVVEHPAFDFLPAAPFEASLGVPEGTAFLGSEVEVVLRVVGAEAGPIRVVGHATGPAALVRVLEEDEVGFDGDRVRTLRWILRVEGAGEVHVGPITARQGAWTASVPIGRVATAAPEDRVAAPAMIVLEAPSAVLDGRTPPSLWREGERAWVALVPGGRVSVEPEARLAVPWVIVRDGEGVAELQALPPGTRRARVRVERDLVLDSEL